MKLVWTAPSRGDLQSIYLYVAAENPVAARKVVARIRERALQLAEFPELGRVGRVADTRELVVVEHPYIVVYSVGPDSVTVLRVWPTKRRWPRKF